MHLQIPYVAPRPQRPRPAKVVQLEVRRQARLETVRPQRRAPKRPAPAA